MVITGNSGGLRIGDVFFFHLHGRGRVVAPIPGNLADLVEQLSLDPGDFTDPIIGYACLGQDERLEPECQGEVHDLLGRSALLDPVCLVCCSALGFDESSGVGCLAGDTVLDALQFHCLEVGLAGEEMGSLSRCVLCHLLAAVLASCLSQFLPGSLSARERGGSEARLRCYGTCGVPGMGSIRSQAE